jgi:autotransporter-associated beta strand protein
MVMLLADMPATEPGVTLHVSENNSSTTYSGVLSGDGILKVGTGTLTLTGVSTHAGPVTMGGQAVYSIPATQPGAVALALPAVTVPVSNALEALRDVDVTLTSFSAEARKTDTDPRSGDTETRVGSVYYQKAAAAPNLAFQVDSYSAPGVRAVTKDELFEFVSPYFVHRDTLGKVFERTLVVKPGAVGSPLKLGSGLLPLPIGQEPAEMVRDFDITEVPLKDAATLPAGTDAKDVIVLKLAPRKAGVYDFLDVTLTVDKKLSLPVMLDETKVDHGTTTFKLDKLQENKLAAPVAAKVFDTTVPAGTGWKVTDTK